MASKAILQKELAKAVHAYNEKIRYHEQKGRDVLPEREYARDLKKKLSTAQDYEREINRLRRFGKADVTKTTTIGRYDNIKITQYEKQEIKRQVDNINRRRARKIKTIQEKEISVGGKRTGFKRAQMPSFREADLSPKKLNWERFGSKKELEKYKETLDYQRMSDYFDRRAEGFKKSYIGSLKTAYGEKNIKPLIDKLSNMKASKIEEMYYSEQDATIEYTYMPTTSEESKIQNIYNIWGIKDEPPVYEEIEI